MVAVGIATTLLYSFMCADATGQECIFIGPELTGSHIVQQKDIYAVALQKDVCITFWIVKLNF